MSSTYSYRIRKNNIISTCLQTFLLMDLNNKYFIGFPVSFIPDDKHYVMENVNRDLGTSNFSVEKR